MEPKSGSWFVDGPLKKKRGLLKSIVRVKVKTPLQERNGVSNRPDIHRTVGLWIAPCLNLVIISWFVDGKLESSETLSELKP